MSNQKHGLHFVSRNSQQLEQLFEGVRMFHHRLHKAREEKGLSQVNIAKRLNMARQTYLDIEYGKTQPRLGTVVNLAVILGVDLEWLITGVGKITPPANKVVQPVHKVTIDNVEYVPNTNTITHVPKNGDNGDDIIFVNQLSDNPQK